MSRHHHVQRPWRWLPLLALAACAADPPPPAEAPAAPAETAAPAAPAAPLTPCEALGKPIATLRRLGATVSFGRSMPVRPLRAGPFAARLDEAAGEARAVPGGDPEIAKIAAGAADRLAKIAAAARALTAKADDERLRVALLEEMERGELVVVQGEQRCEKGGGASGGRLSAAAMESGTGRVSAAALQRALRAGAPEMKRCHEAGLRRDPSLGGTLRIRYVVARDGSVAEAEDADSAALDPLDWGTVMSGPRLRDAEVVACVVAAFRKLAFPKPEGGTFTATYAVELGRAR